MKLIYIGALISLSFGTGTLQAQAAGKKGEAHSGGGSFAREYGTAGCGLGAMLIGKGDGFNQIFATTTNDTVYNQLFGITFGTLNCDGGNVFNKAENIDRFINGNKVALASDIARGNGESIVSLASIMQCSGSEGELGGELQRNFREIFPNHTVPAMEVTDQIITVVGRNENLAKACKVTL